MREPGTNSPEVVEFMTQFARLKLYSDDAPDDLTDLAANDSSVKDLCTQLSFTAHFLQMNERRARLLFAGPADPAFLTAWRDYEERYEAVISDIWLSDLLPELGNNDPSRVAKANLQWQNADDDAAEQASGIAGVIEFAEFKVNQEDQWTGQTDFSEFIREGIAAWDRLERDTGFDLRGVFRRRALIPFVLVPRHVATKYGCSEKLSMFKNLKQAHDSFVFGATYAALALMRSIMEAMLRDYYRVEGKDLNHRIRNARHCLPPGVNEVALQRLRKLANAILHLEREKDEGLHNMDEAHLEKEIVSLLFVLRALIEGVK